MDNKNQVIRFDWAMRHLLRDKTNFCILEGLFTVLLGEKLVIQELLECDNNDEDKFDQYFRIDMLAVNTKGEPIIIELQNNTEYVYLQRILFGTSKLLTEYIERGKGYGNIQKVYCINIIYFSFGHGTDYIYRGKTELRGTHSNELFKFTPFSRQTFNVDVENCRYPEYYILKVNGFNQVAKSPLEEWIYYLNTGEIPLSTTTLGLEAARKQLKLDNMTKEEMKAYYRYLDNRAILWSNIYVAREEGRFEGIQEVVQQNAEGFEEGREYEKRTNARNLKELGVSIDIISQATGLSREEIEKL